MKTIERTRRQERQELADNLWQTRATGLMQGMYPCSQVLVIVPAGDAVSLPDGLLEDIMCPCEDKDLDFDLALPTPNAYNDPKFCTGDRECAWFYSNWGTHFQPQQHVFVATSERKIEVHFTTTLFPADAWVEFLAAEYPTARFDYAYTGFFGQSGAVVLNEVSSPDDAHRMNPTEVTDEGENDMAATIDAAKVTKLWDAVLSEVYQDEPNSEAEADENGDYTTEDYVREDNDEQIAKAIKKAWKYSKKFDFNELPDISGQDDWTGNYYNAVQDSMTVDLDEFEDEIDDVLEWVGEWANACEIR